MNHLETIYSTAVELPLEERAAYFDQACKGDAALRGELDRMLGMAGSADAVFGEAPVSPEL